jgi:hypothetical protein
VIAAKRTKPRRGDSKGFTENQLDFQVNNETYFLDLAEDERQWLVFAQTPTGVRRIPVYVDAPISDEPVLVEDKHRRKIVN